MKILEKELEDAIFDATDEQLKLHGLSGLVDEGIIRRFRQTHLGDDVGRSDLIFVTRKHLPGRFGSVLRINIIELKRGKFGCEALLQAIRYAFAVQSYMLNRNFKPFDIKITIIGEVFEATNNFMHIPHLINRKQNYGYGEVNDISVYAFDFTIDGFQFINSNIGFNKTQTDIYMEELICKKNKKNQVVNTRQNQSEQGGLPF